MTRSSIEIRNLFADPNFNLCQILNFNFPQVSTSNPFKPEINYQLNIISTNHLNFEQLVEEGLAVVSALKIW